MVMGYINVQPAITYMELFWRTSYLWKERKEEGFVNPNNRLKNLCGKIDRNFEEKNIQLIKVKQKYINNTNYFLKCKHLLQSNFKTVMDINCTMSLMGPNITQTFQPAQYYETLTLNSF